MATTTREPVRPRGRTTPQENSRRTDRGTRRARPADTAPPAEFVEPPRRRAERVPAQEPHVDRSSENMRRLRSPFTPDGGNEQQ